MCSSFEETRRGWKLWKEERVCSVEKQRERGKQKGENVNSLGVIVSYLGYVWFGVVRG
jgi:hypothetical protein